jgi:hypothetical protein
MNRFCFIATILFYLSFAKLTAQKSLQYSTFFQGRHYQFVIYHHTDGKISGHFIDFQDKAKYNFAGEHINPGNIYDLECNEHPIISKIRLKEDPNNSQNRCGFYYTTDAYIGFVNFSYRPDNVNFEDNRDIKTVNELYLFMLSDFGFKPIKKSPPFAHDYESGLYVLNPSNGYEEEHGNKPFTRKLLLSEGLLCSFLEQKKESSYANYKQKLYFQVLGYSPYHSVLIISEEAVSNISKQSDTSHTFTYKIAIYSQKAKKGEFMESWKNETNEIIPLNSKEIIESKFPHAKVEINQNYIELIFNRKCRLNPAIPKTLIYVPDYPGSTKNKTLNFNWHDSKMDIE